MANVIGNGVNRIIMDADGETATVTSNRLDVNASLVAGAAIDIGDVEITGHATIATHRHRSVGTSAGNLNGGSGAGGVGSDGDSIACKHIDIMAHIDNTGIMYVGGSGVSALNGIALYTGDVYSVDIDDVNNIFVMGTVDAEDISFTLYN